MRNLRHASSRKLATSFVSIVATVFAASALGDDQGAKGGASSPYLQPAILEVSLPVDPSIYTPLPGFPDWLNHEETVSDTRRVGSGDIFAEMTNRLSSVRRVEDGGDRLEMSLTATHELAGSAFGNRFRALRGEARATGTLRERTRSAQAGFAASFTFGEGRFSYTWSPVNVSQAWSRDAGSGDRIRVSQPILDRQVADVSTSFNIWIFSVQVGLRARVSSGLTTEIGLADRGVGVSGSVRLTGALTGSAYATGGVNILIAEGRVTIESAMTLADAALTANVLLSSEGVDCSLDFALRQHVRVLLHLWGRIFFWSGSTTVTLVNGRTIDLAERLFRIAF